jgi:hypothetical protein
MKYRLAALSAVELKDLNAIRFDGCHDSSCYLLDGQDEWHELVAITRSEKSGFFAATAAFSG